MSRPAAWVASVAVQSAVEARLTARRGENLLAMVAIPLLVLGVMTLAALSREGTSGLVSRTMALAIVASGLVNLGIATAYERQYGVLKRLGGSPLGRSGLVAAKILVVVAIALAQVGALLLCGAILDWPAAPIAEPVVASLALLAVTTLLGATTFASLGLAIAGTLRAEAALVVANVLFLVALVAGGPVGSLLGAGWQDGQLVRSLPPGALADALSAALAGSPDPVSILRPLLVLTVWAIIAWVIAVRTFRWDDD